MERAKNEGRAHIGALPFDRCRSHPFDSYVELPKSLILFDVARPKPHGLRNSQARGIAEPTLIRSKVYAWTRPHGPVSLSHQRDARPPIPERWLTHVIESAHSIGYVDRGALHPHSRRGRQLFSAWRFAEPKGQLYGSRPSARETAGTAAPRHQGALRANRPNLHA